MVFFSIIVPVYNVEKYLEQCIASILNQSYKDFEVILVDDGSKDNSGAICDKFQSSDTRVTVIHQTNGGLSNARNAGTKIAQGKYILYVDSDDYFANDNLLKSIYCKLSETDADLAIYTSQDVYYNGHSAITRGNYDEVVHKDIPEYTRHLLAINNFPGAAWIVCVKASILSTYDILFPVGIMGEDYIWIIKVFSHINSVVGVNDAIYAHRMNVKGSITSKPSLSGMKGMIAALDYIKIFENDTKWWSVWKIYARKILVLCLINYARIKHVDEIKRHILSHVSLLKDGRLHYRMIYWSIKLLGLKLTAKIIYNLYNIKKSIER